jgi:hypothetical protein|tara:strand:- start:345 stop:602 length:258 start_codon:yes stop_codon:yes gene_type:complete
MKGEVDFRELMFMVLLFMWMLMVVPVRLLKEVIEEMGEHIIKLKKIGTRVMNVIRKKESIDLFLITAMIYLSLTLILMLFLKDGL